MTRLIDRRRRLVFETPLLIGKRPLVVLVEAWDFAFVRKGAAGTSPLRGRKFGIEQQSLPQSRSALSAASKVRRKDNHSRKETNRERE